MKEKRSVIKPLSVPSRISMVSLYFQISWIFFLYFNTHTHIHRFPKPQEYPIRLRTIHKVQEYQADRIFTYLPHE